MTIPNIIHQIWFQGAKQIPDHLRPYHESWTALNPTYKIILWDEPKIQDLLAKQQNPSWQVTYDGYDKMIQKIDFAKYVILFVYGGIYVDMDIKCLQSVDKTPHLEVAEVILSELPSNIFRQTMFCVLGSLSIRHDIIINNGTIMCVSQHDIMKFTIEEAIKRRHYPNFSNAIHIFYTTGPLALSTAYKRAKKSKLKDSSIYVLDKSYFENCDMFEINTDTCTIPPHAIGIHYYANTWHSKTEQFVMSITYFLLKYWYISLSALFIGVIIIYNKVFASSSDNIRLSSKRRMMN